MLKAFGKFMVFLVFIVFFFLSILLATLAWSNCEYEPMKYAPLRWTAAFGAFVSTIVTVYIWVVHLTSDDDHRTR